MTAFPHVNPLSQFIKCSTETEAMEAVFAVDDARIYWRKEIAGRMVRGWAFIVLGNCGWDAICDNAANDFDAEVVEPLTPYLNKLEEEFDGAVA